MDQARIDDLDAYIFTVAHHETLNFIRHSLTLTMTPIGNAAVSRDSGDDTERDLEYQELLNMVYAEISHMPEKRRKIFLMSREEGLSNQEIADRQPAHCRSPYLRRPARLAPGVLRLIPFVFVE